MASPWESPVFIGLLPRMINTFTPDALRSECVLKRLITRQQEERFAALASPTQHNEALLDAIRAGDGRSFHIFLECIRNVEPIFNVKEILAKLESIDKYQEAKEADLPTDLQELEKVMLEAAKRGGTTTIRFLHVA
eukprot:scpid109056/ scgid12178/ 